jgi:hypothetical protein
VIEELDCQADQIAGAAVKKSEFRSNWSFFRTPLRVSFGRDRQRNTARSCFKPRLFAFIDCSVAQGKQFIPVDLISFPAETTTCSGEQLLMG